MTKNNNTSIEQKCHNSIEALFARYCYLNCHLFCRSLQKGPQSFSMHCNKLLWQLKMIHSQIYQRQISSKDNTMRLAVYKVQPVIQNIVLRTFRCYKRKGCRRSCHFSFINSKLFTHLLGYVLFSRVLLKRESTRKPCDPGRMLYS